MPISFFSFCPLFWILPFLLDAFGFSLLLSMKREFHLHQLVGSGDSLLELERSPIVLQTAQRIFAHVHSGLQALFLTAKLTAEASDGLKFILTFFSFVFLCTFFLGGGVKKKKEKKESPRLLVFWRLI